MSRLTDLIAQAKTKDPQLGADLDREFKALSSRLPFGLNFERHRPEVVELPLRPIRKGDKVRVLPARGSANKGDPRLWQVMAIHRAAGGKVVELALLGAEEAQTQTVALDDLVVVAEFRDTIYPGLVSTGKVQQGEDKPFHTVINGENYHVLKALTYTHRGKVDAIYIDPPYNSGARDWKYNNDYVEGDDLYRHSKWLAMIERRLLVAKELLISEDSVLIVTIDEKEYLRLGLLLEQLFPEARIQMVSSVINHSGVARAKEFYRADEYLFFVFIGDAAGGSNVIRSVIPGRRFPFPKSLYAVEDALRFFVVSKPDAVVLDFFAGSGTTAHAVMRLNHQDDGRRQCISITNNEAAADEQKVLREQGLRPGDSEWEKWGICDYITKPRVQAAITGKTPDGEPIKGDYKFTDEFPMADGFEENAEFFTLTYETPVSVNHNRAFARIAPMLWLRAGSRGRRIDKLPVAGWDVVEAYGLLADVDCASPFIKAVGKARELSVAYIVTDDDRRFQAISRRLPDWVEPVRLYESYLTNFSFANGE